MKNIAMTIIVLFLGWQQSFACSWYEPDYEYFNLFTQSIIQNKAYTPFLLSYSNPYYEDKDSQIPDDNIAAWQSYFKNQLSFQETKDLVYTITLEELNDLKFKRKVNNPILKKLGYGFYSQYQDAIDYLIEAKYIEPYMYIQQIENPDAWRSYDTDVKTADDLDYNKISSDLKNLYNATNSKEIKLRYGYQLVRFNHYNRKYQEAIKIFYQYVIPVMSDSAPYYMALDQMAGAQRGLGMLEESNWNFFQVFKNSDSRKKSAYTSMRYTTEVSFEDLLIRSKTKEDKILAYFLLAYQSFNNPLPMMQKIYELDPNSEALMVLEARAINELEREILHINYNHNNAQIINTKANTDIANDPRRIPIVSDSQKIYDRFGEYKESPTKKYLQDIASFTKRMRKNSNDAFWDISDAYLQFLQKDYTTSQQILENISTSNKDYKTQVDKMKMLNKIVSQPVIDAKFEEYLMANYSNFFKEDSDEELNLYDYNSPTTKDFIKDVLANRYYIQKEYAKSFLMSNYLASLEYNPNFELAKSLEAYYNKPNKSTLEEQVLNKNLNFEDPKSFFSLIFGDYYARHGDYKKALSNYKAVTNGKGFIPTIFHEYDYNTGESTTRSYPKDKFDFYHSVSPYIFGHHNIVSYNNEEAGTMSSEPFMGEFNFIQKRHNKAELMQSLIKLEEIANGTGDRAAKANQLLGNVLYNTSKMGYFRHIFVFDINNGRSEKFDYYNQEASKNTLYYKNYYSIHDLTDKNEELAERYYQKALKLSEEKEQKARILFQLANVEQAQFYQYIANMPDINYEDYDNEVYYQKREEQEQEINQIRKAKFKTYFNKIKQEYTDTKTIQKIRSNCKYLDSYLHN